jgi:hypothetical protein
MIKIRVGIPSYDGKLTVPTQETVNRLRACTDIDFEIIQISGTFCYRARNISSLAVVKDGGGKIKQVLPYDYYLAMDADVAFDVQNIKRLLAKERDIVGGAYPLRAGRTDLVVAGCWDSIPGSSSWEKWLRVYNTGLVEVDWCGAGCLLVKKEVLEKMNYPYWIHRTVVIGELADHTSEDIGFCMTAKELGYKIYCDLDNRIAHIPK